ncbi:unnamed protein product [Nesidiocoris tenuis]|uniref:Uncharacterized protein n=1 Tax=Nesidiocoris tenuis TaxID=355587 RepID=A0A6H5HP17_9HEMI|nr:unnamed protein product [Nesidiocoris tenuis]
MMRVRRRVEGWRKLRMRKEGGGGGKDEEEEEVGEVGNSRNAGIFHCLIISDSLCCRLVLFIDGE